MSGKPLTLEAGGSELILAPQTGGSVRAWRRDGRHLLRPGPPDRTAGPLELAGFPLFPFSGRIANGVFDVDGRRVELPGNFPPEPHAIHGQAWQAAWAVDAADRQDAVLSYTHDGAVWPWRYRARQRFSLSSDTLRLELSLLNLDAVPMPAGFGWHPYFPADGATLCADVSAIWRGGADSITPSPQPLAPAESLAAPRPVEQLEFDHCFTAGHGATLCWPSRRLTLRITASPELPFLVIYTPRERGFFCVEPVSHTPDAVNSHLPAAVTGLRMLQPQESFSAWLELRVEIG